MDSASGPTHPPLSQEAVMPSLSSAPTAVLRAAARRAAAPTRTDYAMSTAEYALGTVAACAFAAVLYAILTSGAVRSALTSMVTDALSVGG
ncbi:uncharacterized protein DUF4244 [Murinocardiopsis flavida]|uniref:Uncharacterized protein DUF4244 n=1 Tax=Murinocardiopsis flavida TaxID=645275 RepID=A0A2P8DQD4_9ACTN|nr:uncharacterized protein DUF4244 [Murinocardiopsis flavida]